MTADVQLLLLRKTDCFSFNNFLDIKKFEICGAMSRSRAFDKNGRISTGLYSFLALGIGIIFAIFQESGEVKVIRDVLKMWVITGYITGKIIFSNFGLILSRPVAFD